VLFAAVLSCAFAAEYMVDVTWPNSDTSWAFLKFYPQQLTIQAGDNVTWNLRSEANTITFPAGNYPLIVGGDANYYYFHPLVLPYGGSAVTSPSAMFSTGFLFPGLTATFTFPNPGTYSYMDLLHGFTGTIIVVAQNVSVPFTPTEIMTAAATAEANDLLTINAYVTANNLGTTDFPEVLDDGTKVVHVGFMDPVTGASYQRFIPHDPKPNVGDKIMFKNPTLHVHTVTINESGVFAPFGLNYDPTVTVLGGQFGAGVPEGAKVFLDPSSPTILNGYVGGFVSGGLLIPYATVNITFAAEGTYPLQCSFHESLGMKGIIDVGRGSSASSIAISAAVLVLAAMSMF